MKVAIISLYNGEGYSEPELEIVENNPTEIKKTVDEFVKMFTSECFDKVEEKEEETLLFSFEEKEEENCGAINKIELPENKFHLLSLLPDVCSAIIYDSYSTKEEAIYNLKLQIINKNDSFEQDDIEDYDGGDIFSSHLKGPIRSNE